MGFIVKELKARSEASGEQRSAQEKGDAKDQNAHQKQSRAHGAVVDESFQEAPAEEVPEIEDP